MRARISVDQWRAENARLFRKHNRAGALMMRHGLKERTKRKWMNAYRRYLDRIPSPEAVCDIYEPDWQRLPFATVPNSAMIEFDNGQREVVSRNALRRHNAALTYADEGGVK